MLKAQEQATHWCILLNLESAGVKFRGNLNQIYINSLQNGLLSTRFLLFLAASRVSPSKECEEEGWKGKPNNLVWKMSIFGFKVKTKLLVFG